MLYEHRFRVKTDLKPVANFHFRVQSMADITPPPIITQIHQIPPAVADGAEMAFTLWMGPIPVRWAARFEDVTPEGFSDRQIRGPFSKWVHRHHFIACEDGTTEVYDRVEASFHPGLLKGILGRIMWWNLPILFAYRGWRTRKMLEK